ncbi:hypothetical protein COCC4DRAFT_143473 [Bipolaris maydis ATCC 48331]|uniref:HTH psq-type domain-containing protein n=1 Tax=Cochliobolus heterostrophus (strain C4 / ATCC 48331 / race T) TaxID=665024 RepID=N4X3H6_COCH4|nr:uncharacterized protein COCC4DRAFT_143473 [Bipolaris maydis ATCC 48331]ENI03033.1 hypothetical protein COCC4DRAFT_143473 [Bipolaris maydis ATCC 48331]
MWSVHATVQPMQHHQPHQNFNPLLSTRNISTTMTALTKAIAAIDSQDAEGQLSYRAAAKKFGVELTTLTRRHQNKTQSPAAAAQNVNYSLHHKNLS